MQTRTSYLGLTTRACGTASAGPWILLAKVTGDFSAPPEEPAKALDVLKAALGEGCRRALPRVQDLLGIYSIP